MNGVVDSASSPSTGSPRYSSEELERFQRDGALILRGFVDADTLQLMRNATRRGLEGPIGPVEYEADVHYPGSPTSRTAAGGETIRRLKAAHGRDPVFTEWVSRPEVTGRLEQVLGGRVVMPLAHHNCIMTKQPHWGSVTRWHQDFRYWSFARPELVNLWIALGHEEESNGGLQVIPGTHRVTFSRDRLDDALFLREDHPENIPLIASRQVVDLEPGDVLMFHCLTFHAAGQNHSEATKCSAVFTFRHVDNLPKPGSRSAEMGELLLPGIDHSGSEQGRT
jgi:phytanoyl-CoA hydroxylase